MNENSISIRWFFLPPFTALPMIIIANVLSSGHPVSVDAALWGLVGLLFIVLTVLYGIFIRQDFSIGLLPVQLIAQGLLLCPLALHLGARMLQWVGVTMTVCGAVVLVVLYYRTRFTPAYLPPDVLSPSSDSVLSALPLPFAVTDGEGNILSVSDALLKIAAQTREKVEGEKITLLLPLDKEFFTLAGKEWKILQSPMKKAEGAEGDRYYFQLEEVSDAQVAVTLPSRSEGELNFVDPATTLYARFFAIKRVNEELYRIRRYQRWMSATLLRMTFTYSGADESPSKEDSIFNAYCRFIRSNTREADISCLVGPRDVLVVMPETPLEAAREVASKLADFALSIQDQLAGFNGDVAVRDGTVFFGTALGSLSFDEFLNKLDEALEAGV